MTNDTFIASAVKVTAVNTGAAISMAADTGTISHVAGVLAATYSAVQLFKALPWLSDYMIAIWSGVARSDWAHWRSIARRTEKSSNDNAE